MTCQLGNGRSLDVVINGRVIDLTDLADPSTSLSAIELPGVLAAVLMEQAIEFGQSQDACIEITDGEARRLVVTAQLRACWLTDPAA